MEFGSYQTEKNEKELEELRTFDKEKAEKKLEEQVYHWLDSDSKDQTDFTPETFVARYDKIQEMSEKQQQILTSDSETKDVKRKKMIIKDIEKDKRKILKSGSALLFSAAVAGFCVVLAFKNFLNIGQLTSNYGWKEVGEQVLIGFGKTVVEGLIAMFGGSIAKEALFDFSSSISDLKNDKQKLQNVDKMMNFIEEQEKGRSR